MPALPLPSSSRSPELRPADSRGAGTAAAQAAAALPASAQTERVTRLLEAARGGRRAAADELLPLVYDELRALAASLFRSQRRDHTLQPTALVHEVYARLVKPRSETGDNEVGGEGSGHWTGRAHFFAVAAKAMRQVLANHARDRRAGKRGGDWQRVTLSDKFIPGSERGLDLLALDEALQALSELDERQGRIVELRFFGEMTSEEIAHVLEVSVSTVEREWRMARAWLSGRLRSDERAANA